MAARGQVTWCGRDVEVMGVTNSPRGRGHTAMGVSESVGVPGACRQSMGVAEGVAHAGGVAEARRRDSGRIRGVAQRLWACQGRGYQAADVSEARLRAGGVSGAWSARQEDGAAFAAEGGSC